MKHILKTFALLLAIYGSVQAFAGYQFPIAFSKSVCPGDFEDQLAALNALNKLVYDELASCTAGVFKGSGSFLSIEKIGIREQFSHMCDTGQAILFAEVAGKCTIP